jgi:hypothetical protein
MQHDVSGIISTQFTTNLDALRNILIKAQAHAKARNFDENKYLDMKLAPDMLNFTKQIQIACDTAKFSVSRLSGKTAPVFADEEKTLTELIARISNTMEYVQGFKKEDFTNYKNTTQTFPWMAGVSLSGSDYLTQMAIPNFYFHISMTYALLRSAGVELGKNDFLGKVNWAKA